MAIAREEYNPTLEGGSRERYQRLLELDCIEIEWLLFKYYTQNAADAEGDH